MKKQQIKKKIKEYEKRKKENKKKSQWIKQIETLQKRYDTLKKYIDIDKLNLTKIQLLNRIILNDQVIRYYALDTKIWKQDPHINCKYTKLIKYHTIYIHYHELIKAPHNRKIYNFIK